jgi:hypothetical protein
MSDPRDQFGSNTSPAEARCDVKMPDSSDRGISGERIDGQSTDSDNRRTDLRHEQALSRGAESIGPRAPFLKQSADEAMPSRYAVTDRAESSLVGSWTGRITALSSLIHEGLR